MPYIQKPRWAKVAEKTLFAITYSLLMVQGWMYFTLAPMGWIGLVCVVLALSCLFGAVTGRYRWEWVAVGPLAAFTLVGMIGVHIYITQYAMFFVVIVAVVLARRFLQLTLIAKALRNAAN